jgi:cell division protein FtsZ
MIQLNRNYSLPEREEEIIPIKVIGVGGAGSNALDRVVLDGMDKSDLIAANTDVQSLASSVAAAKVQLGRSITRGLGTGGDPELGLEAGQESVDEIRAALASARMIFICTGLGGGTGSGASPLIAQLAREMGALVIAFATMPFTFEGKRRASQANEALARLHEIADAVVCFENDRMGDLVAPKAGIHQAFAVADMTISQSVRAIVNLIQRPGIMRVGFDDLLAALRSGGRCLFGYGESDSDNRAHEALTQALKNPLMDRGRMLAEASRVLVQVAGGPGMTLSEIEILMRDLNKCISDETQLLFGTAVDGRMGNRLSVTIISSLRSQATAESAPAHNVVQVESFVPERSTPAPMIETPPEPVAVESNQNEIISQSRVEQEELLTSPSDEISAPSQPAANVIEPKPEILAEESKPGISVQEETCPRIIPPKKNSTPAAKSGGLQMPPAGVEKTKAEKPAPAKQEVLQFEPVTRGRFEKSEPTIVEGQDLDVPTFLRKNVRVK